MVNLPTKSINLAIVIALCAPVWPHTPDLCHWTYHNSCLCTPEDTEEGHVYQVQCGEQNLTSVPKTTGDITVSLFNLSFNDLQTLEEDALFKYKSVKYLYLQHCKISDINKKAFLDLENLIVLDLSNNYLTSFSPDFFKGNHLLQKLILRRNKFSALHSNIPLLNGPAALSVLDVHSCKLSHISLVTFSLIPNLTVLDVSNNDLAVLDLNILSSHRQLEDVNLENNPWKCGTEFNELVCWMHNKLAVFHSRTVSCQNQSGTWETWPTKTWSSLCGPITNPSHERDTITSTKLNQSVSPANKSVISTNSTLKPSAPSEKKINSTDPLVAFEFTTVMTIGLITMSVDFPLPVRTVPLTSKRDVETEAAIVSEQRSAQDFQTEGWASLLSWNVNTLMVFVILPLTLGTALIVSLIAVNYFTKRCTVDRRRHDTEGNDNHRASFFSNVPLQDLQLTADLTQQRARHVNRNSDGVSYAEYHVYEEID